MGRPIKKIFIGERGVGGPDGTGEGLASIAITDGGTGYTTGALVISAPDLVGGVQAEGTFTATAGIIDGVLVTVPGSGYTSAPTIDGDAGGAGDAILDGALTFTNSSIIKAFANTGGSSQPADIKAQKGTTRYRVTTADGTLECTLVQKVGVSLGEMIINATDSGGGTYWVKKLYNNTVVLTENSGGGEFVTGDKVKWGDVAVLNDTVKITG